MSTAILLREAEWLCMDNCQDYAARIGIAKDISARHLGSASSGTRRCLTGVDSRSKWAPEFVAIDEQPYDEIVHALRLGEAQRTTH